MGFLVCLLLQDVGILDEGSRKLGIGEKAASQYERIVDPEKFKALWKELHPDGKRECPEVGFQEWMILVVGKVNSNAWYEKPSVKEAENILRVTYTMVLNPIDGGGPQGRFQYTVLKAKRSTARVHFVEIDFDGKTKKVVKELEALK